MAQAVELSQGNEFARNAESGPSVDSARRVFRVLLSAPDESWSIPATIGIDIGDEYSESNPIPCVSWEARADGDSRLVRIVTVNYKATPGFASDGVSDPKTEQPTVRPAIWSMSTSLQEIAAFGGRAVSGSGSNATSGDWRPAVNPVGDLVDGLTRLEPVVTISIDQYSTGDESARLAYVGYINSDVFTFSSLSVGAHCCMLQGISSTPIVEQFKTGMFRGFKITFTFGVRAHWTLTRHGVQPIGWDLAVPQCGLNIINDGLNNANVDQDALNLQHEYDKIYENPRFLVAGTAGTRVRAAIAISSPGGGSFQRPAAAPVPLNDDGTPRSRTANPPVLINRICTQPEMEFGNNFTNLGIRIA